MKFITKILGMTFLFVLLLSSDLFSGNIKSLKTKNNDVLLSTSLKVLAEKKETINSYLLNKSISLDVTPATTGVLQQNTYMIPEVMISVKSDDPYVKDEDFSILIKYTLTLEFEQAGSTQTISNQTLNVNQDNPYASLTYKVKENLVKSENLTRITIKVTSVTLPSNPLDQSYSVKLEYLLNYSLAPRFYGSSDPIVYIEDNNQTKIINTNKFTPAYLNWDFYANYDSRAERPHSYQIQLLKLNNTGDYSARNKFSFGSYDLPYLEATVNWDDAITFETGSELTHAWFFITDGTGYYIWRVRPIGNKYFGGFANSLNYGSWANYSYLLSGSPKTAEPYNDNIPINIKSSNDFTNFHGFYYEQPESDKNWTFQQFYFEEYSDSTKLASTISYADALLNPLQSQRYIYSKDQSIIQHNVLDYAAKPAIISLPVPNTDRALTNNGTDSKATISFETGLLKSGTREYSASDFDQITNYLNINTASGEVSSYYNGDNFVPDSEGYPFSRSIDLGDEIISSMPGKTHRIDKASRHNKRVYYSAISDQELLSVMGNERPVKKAIYKEIIIDENGNISFVYKNKFGKTIATAIAPNTVDGLENLDNDPIGAQESKQMSLNLYNPNNDNKVEVKSTTQKFFSGVSHANIYFSVGNIPYFSYFSSCFNKTVAIPMKDAELGYSKSIYGQADKSILFYEDQFVEEFSFGVPFNRDWSISSLKGDGNYTFYWNFKYDYSHIDQMRIEFNEELNNEFDLVFGDLLDSIAYYKNLDMDIDSFYINCMDKHFDRWSIPQGEKNYTYGADWKCHFFELPRLSCAGDISEKLWDYSNNTIRWDRFEEYLLENGMNLESNYIDSNRVLLKDLSKYLYMNGQRIYQPSDLNESIPNYDERPHPINDLIYNMWKEEDSEGNPVYDPKGLAFAWQTLCDNYSTLAFKMSNGKDGGIAQTMILNTNFDIIKEFLNLTGRMYEGISNFTEIHSTEVSNPKYKYINSGVKVQDANSTNQNLYGLDFVRYAYKYFLYSPDEYITKEYIKNNQNDEYSWIVPFGAWEIDFAGNSGSWFRNAPFEFTYVGTSPTISKFSKLIVDHSKTTESTVYEDQSAVLKRDVAGHIPKDENFEASKPWENIYNSQQSHILAKAMADNMFAASGAEDQRNRDILGSDTTMIDDKLEEFKDKSPEEIDRIIQKQRILDDFYANVVRDAYQSCDIFPDVIGVKPDPGKSYVDITRFYDDVRMLADTVHSINLLNIPYNTLFNYFDDEEVIRQYAKLKKRVAAEDFKLLYSPRNEHWKTDNYKERKQKYSDNKLPEVLLSHNGRYFSEKYVNEFKSELSFKLKKNLLDNGLITNNRIEFKELLNENIRKQNRRITIDHYEQYLGIKEEEIENLFAFPNLSNDELYVQHPTINTAHEELDINTIALREHIVTNRIIAVSDAQNNVQEIRDFLYSYPYTYIPQDVKVLVDIRDHNNNFVKVAELECLPENATRFNNEPIPSGFGLDGGEEIGTWVPGETNLGFNPYYRSILDKMSFFWNYPIRIASPTWNKENLIMFSSAFFCTNMYPFTWGWAQENTAETIFKFVNKYNASYRVNNTSYGFHGKKYNFLICYPNHEVDTKLDEVLITESPSCSDVLYEQLRSEIFATFTKWKEAKLQKFDDAVEEFKKLDLDYQPEYRIEYTEGVNQNYTLFFYDRSGNLIRSVPPAGVHYNQNATETSIPQYSLETRYRYDGNNKLLKQKSPDEDEESTMIYNDAGQLRFSISPNQVQEKTFSYIKYDEYGRVVESGESTVKHDAYELSDIANDDLTQRKFGSAQYPKPTDFSSRTKTFYSVPFSKIDQMHAQRNISGRVSYVVKEEKRNGSDLIVTESAYSYDPMGNVEWIATAHFSYLPEMQYSPWEYPQILTLVNYSYDLVSGKVTLVDFKAQYNPHKEDENGTFPDYSLWKLQNVHNHRFLQKYKYDTDNRIVEVMSSMDSLYWESDARYDYYKHGPLKRTEYGNDLLQGVDFTYTIQGWLKGINNRCFQDYFTPASSSYNHPLTNDPGGDYNNDYLQDYFGTVLYYFDGDYKNSDKTFDRGDMANSPNFNQYFNGNISSIEYGYNIDALFESSPDKVLNYLNKYSYDKLYRVKEFQNYEVDQHYHKYCSGINGETSTYSYDPSGNISRLSRYSGGAKFDDLVYEYTPLSAGSPYKLNNKLNKVDELVTSNQHGDLEFYKDETYTYDAEGNLETVTIAGSTFAPTNIEWDVNGKIKTIEFRIDLDAENCNIPDPHIHHLYGSYNCKIENFYDAAGNRICKCMTSEDLKQKIQSIYGDMGPLKPMTMKIAKKIGLWHKFYYYDANNLMLASFTMYNHCSDSQLYTHDAWYLYGSGGDGRVAVVTPIDTCTLLTPGPDIIPDPGEDIGFAMKYKSLRQIGHKQYELTDHLGNVRLTFSDYRYDSPNYTKPRLKVLSRNNYFPFGMLMPDRFANEEDARPRFGFNGMEREDEIAGVGNSYTAMFWQYDSRTARRWNLDPVDMYSISRYATFANNPIAYTDPLGDEVNTEQLTSKEDGKLKHRQAVQAFEAILHTEEGKQWWIDRAAEGQVYEFQIYEDEDLVAEEDGKIHKEGIDYTLEVKPEKDDPKCPIPDLEKDGRLRIKPYVTVTGSKYFIKEDYYTGVVRLTKAWLHEFGYHGTLYENAKIAFNKGLKTLKYSKYGLTYTTYTDVWRVTNISMYPGSHDNNMDLVLMPSTFYGNDGWAVLKAVNDYYIQQTNIGFSLETLKLMYRSGNFKQSWKGIEKHRLNTKEYFEKEVFNEEY